MPERVLHFLGGGLFENMRRFLVACGTRDLSKIAILDVRHRIHRQMPIRGWRLLYFRSLHDALLGD